MPFTAEPQDDLFELLEKIAKGSNTVFVGKFQRGTHESKKVFSAVDLIENFGYPTEDNYNDWYQAYNFLQYGIPLNITRVLNDNSKNAEGYVGFSSFGYLYTKNPDVPIYNESAVRFGNTNIPQIITNAKETINLFLYDYAFINYNINLEIKTQSLVKVKSDEAEGAGDGIDKHCSINDINLSFSIFCEASIKVKKPQPKDSAINGFLDNLKVHAYSGVPLIDIIVSDSAINNTSLGFPIYVYCGLPLTEAYTTDSAFIEILSNFEIFTKSKSIHNRNISNYSISNNSFPSEIFVKSKSVYNESNVFDSAFGNYSEPSITITQSKDIVKKRFQDDYASRSLFNFNYGIYTYAGIKLSDSFLKDSGTRDIEIPEVVISNSVTSIFHGSAKDSAYSDDITLNIDIELTAKNITVLSTNYKDSSINNVIPLNYFDLRTYPNVPLWRTQRGTIAATPLAESDKFYLFGGEYYYVASEDTFYDLVDSYISLPNQHNSQQSITVSDGTETHTIPLRNIVTTRITDMTSLFEGKVLFNQNIDLWDIRYVNSMYRMFYDAKDFNQDIGSWETRYVNDMEYMFFGAETFNQNLSLWDVISIPSIPDGFADGAVNWVNLDWYPPWGQAFTVTPPYDLSIVYTSDTDDKSILVINSVEVQENGKTMFISRAKPRELYIPSTDFDLDSDGVYIPSTDFELE